MLSLPDAPQSAGFELQQLREQHNEILRLKVMGMTQKDIAAQLGVTPMMVNYTLNSELGREKMAHLQDAADLEAIDVSEEIQVAAQKAVKLQHEIISGKHPLATLKLRSDAAKDMLDRAGHSKITKIEGRFSHGYLGEIGVKMIKERAREIGLATGDIIEIAAEESEQLSLLEDS
jgi:predicted transcriptional regulator